MITAGVDLGSLWTKAVVLSDGALVGRAEAPAGDNGPEAAEELLGEALHSAGVSRDGLAAIAATGAGKSEARFATQQVTEVLCAARGARFLVPHGRLVIDMGGESTRVVQLDPAGEVLEFALNEKCAAGTGVFLDAMAKLLQVEQREMGRLSLESTADVNITSTCVAFAESEVVSQIHRQTPKKDILRGIHRSIATRVYGLVGRMGQEGESVAIGGLARNIGIVAWLEELMKRKLTIPENPHLAAAIGAALVGAQKAGAR